jgi:hypothetical protein
VGYAFDILCNKWKIFHSPINVCPDFCDVIVKTCCILHNFFRQRDGFQFRDTLYQSPLESIKTMSNRSNVIGTIVTFAHTPHFHIATCQTRANPHEICRGGSGTWYKFFPQNFAVPYQCYRLTPPNLINLYYKINCSFIRPYLV